ncbi:MAG: hypothetical protein KGI27_11610 [Thaumarchaeota archaeon]|nr:hypothetical protein [Nitrososphaerota archaeon]
MTLSENEFAEYSRLSFGRNARHTVKTRDKSSVIDLIPTLFDMAKTTMNIRCDLDKANVDYKILEDLSRLESAIVKMTSDIEHMRRKGQ